VKFILSGLPLRGLFRTTYWKAALFVPLCTAPVWAAAPALSSSAQASNPEQQQQQQAQPQAQAPQAQPAIPLQTAQVTYGQAVISYVYAAGEGEGPRPLLVFLSGAADPGVDVFKNALQPLASVVLSRGWHIAAPLGIAGIGGFGDNAAMLLRAVTEDAERRLQVDPTRVYLLSGEDAALQVFYSASRTPDVFAAAVAVEGDVKRALDTNRVFGGNTAHVPVIWFLPEPAPPLARLAVDRLKAARFNVDVRSPKQVSVPDLLDALAAHTRDEFPAKVDCETGSLAFGRCYWVQMTKLDPGQRNDVLGSTRVLAGTGAHLTIGPFGYNVTAPGPGIEVEWLPQDYKGPLRLKDRILSVGGKDIANAVEYVQMMDETKEERETAVIVQRGNNKVRLETRIGVPKPPEPLTARVTAEYVPDLKEVMIISRGVTELRVTVPEAWVPGTVSWNGSEVAKAERPGCWVANLEGEMKVSPCAPEAAPPATPKKAPPSLRKPPSLRNP
jgi:hypothetical protein